MKSSMDRKAESIAKLKEMNVPYNEYLPVIENSENVRIRTGSEIAKRAIACLISIQAVFDLHGDADDETKAKSKSLLINLLESFDVMDELTEKERKLLFSEEVSQQDKINMTWKYEAYWVLLWALHLVDELKFPSEICDCDHAIRAVAKHQDFESFIENVKLRDIEEILDECDLIFRYDWACVDARIKGSPAPVNLDSSVVLERHRAFNWLIDLDKNNDWDHVSVNT